MNYLIAVDLEGVHGVVGKPYEFSLTRYLGIPRGSKEYAEAVAAATDEVNAVAKALFDAGATQVCVWDNHAGGGNLDFSKIDGRVTPLVPDSRSLRMQFLEDYDFDGMLFLGYHTRAGSVDGVLSHTYNSREIHYIKINGKQVGEYDIDSRTCGAFGVPALFAAGDDAFCKQVTESTPFVQTAITKYAKGRHGAILREKKEVLQDIRDGAQRALKAQIKPVSFAFPLMIEIRYSEMELAADRIEGVGRYFDDLRYGEDAFTLQATIKDIDGLRRFF